MIEEKRIIPSVALRGLVILPEMVVHFDVSRKVSIAAIEKAMTDGEVIFLVTQKDPNIEKPEIDDLYGMGTIAEIKQIIKLPNDTLRVLVIGRQRAYLEGFLEEESYLYAQISPYIQDVTDLGDELKQKAMMRALKESFAEYALLVPKLKKEAVVSISEVQEIEKLVDEVAATVLLEYKDRQAILEEVDMWKRYELVSHKIINEIEILHIKEDIQTKVKERVDKQQREYILREQLKQIKEELGENTTDSDAEEFSKAVEELDAKEEVKEKIKKEIARFRNVGNNSAENGVVRTYIETMLEMPWNKKGEDNTNIEYAKEILEAEHYGLEKVKERILEFLAVRALTQKGHSPILCLVGPPGTGKTSIAKSLAKSLEKKYVRISLGGVRDEAEIRGHRKTYVGAMPGRIANAMKTAGEKNPLLLLDEIDKVSTDYKGDTFSALLEVLDSEQNHKFRDHYLEVPLDLSEVLFVATANSLQTIPRPLLDRMEIIEVNSYTENEKLHIAKRHLIPKQLEAHGINEGQLSISKAAIAKIARNYTKEAGVRQLERKISEIARKAAKEIFETKKEKLRVSESNLEKYLGREKYRYQMKNETDEIGIVRGLAWTSVGGDTLQIEVNVMPGKGEITLTGQMGDVMKESAVTGISYLRSVGKEHGIAHDFFEKHDIHIHIPEGAVPKDGPSAGISMATAMLSAIAEIKVRADVAMTGEITLRGRVLPIGGLKEKLLAAKNAGISTVIVPMENKRDVEEITAEITKDLEIVFAEHMCKVLEVALAR